MPNDAGSDIHSPHTVILPCSACAETAGRLDFSWGPGGWMLTRKGMSGTTQFAGSASEVPGLVEALATGRCEALYRINLEWVPWYCPTCALVYCKAHWKVRSVFDKDGGSVWHDSERGTCPKGHDRMLED